MAMCCGFGRMIVHEEQLMCVIEKKLKSLFFLKTNATYFIATVTAMVDDFSKKKKKV